MERGLTVKTLEVSSRQPTESKKERIRRMAGVSAVWPSLRTIMTILSRKLGASNSKKESSSGTRITGQGLADPAIWTGSLTSQENSNTTKTTSKECGSCENTTQKGTGKDSTQKRTWKLTPDQKHTIFKLYCTGHYSQQELANKYGINASSVHRIVKSRMKRL